MLDRHGHFAVSSSNSSQWHIHKLSALQAQNRLVTSQTIKTSSTTGFDFLVQPNSSALATDPTFLSEDEMNPCTMRYRSAVGRVLSSAIPLVFRTPATILQLARSQLVPLGIGLELLPVKGLTTCEFSQRMRDVTHARNSGPSTSGLGQLIPTTTYENFSPKAHKATKHKSHSPTAFTRKAF